MNTLTLAQAMASGTAAAHHIDNTPPPDVMANLERLDAVWTKVVALLGGTPITPQSVYRCPEVNRLVGGQPTSYHMAGCAIDFHPPAPWTHDEAQHAIGAEADIDFDLIMEESTLDGAHRWLHLQVARPGAVGRRLVRDASVAALGGPIVHTSTG